MFKVTLEQWRMFRAVVDNGGFNQAAGAINKSPSTIHNAIQKLESGLDLRLFKMIGRRATLTHAGELVLRRASHLLDEAEKLEVLSHRLRSSQDGRIRIAVDQVFPRQRLHQALTAVSDAFPNANIDVFESTLSGTTELLKHGEVDIAIGAYPVADRYSEEIDHIDFLAVVSPAHALSSRRASLTMEDLIPYRQIVVRDSGHERKLDHGWLGANQRWTVDNVETSVQLVSLGFGYAWLPNEAIKDKVDRGELVPLPLSFNHTKTSQFYLMANDLEALGELGHCFVDAIRLSNPMKNNLE
jgi:DNA-binding transcriptional LysR family regulator